MADDHKPATPLQPHSRKYLEELLAQCQNLPGNERLIAMIEQTLADKPLTESNTEPATDLPGTIVRQP